MEIRIEVRDEYPMSIENIGLGKWHVRWNVREIEEEMEGEIKTHYEYNEVTLDHEPTAKEVQQITAK